MTTNSVHRRGLDLGVPVAGSGTTAPHRRRPPTRRAWVGSFTSTPGGGIASSVSWRQRVRPQRGNLGVRCHCHGATTVPGPSADPSSHSAPAIPSRILPGAPGHIRAWRVSSLPVPADGPGAEIVETWDHLGIGRRLRQE